MSHKKAKAERKAVKEAKKDFEKRREEMMAEMKKLSEKYKIDIQGAMQYTHQGIVPMVAFVDVKDQYEHLTKEAEAAKKGNGELKTKLKV